jgi:hypothetical protein
MKSLARSLATTALLCCGLAACAATPTGWTPLFDGRSLAGWKHVGGGSFEVEDGLLHTRGGMGLLWYEGRKFEDVRIKVVYRAGRTDNSGLFIRIPEPPTEPWMPVNRGYEVQIDDSADEYHVTGVLYSLTRAGALPPPERPGWNEMIVTLDGDRTLVEVNGVLVTDFREGDDVAPRRHDYEPLRGPRPRAGYIGLQNHDEKDHVVFREISVQPLAR